MVKGLRRRRRRRRRGGGDGGGRVERDKMMVGIVKG